MRHVRSATQNVWDGSVLAGVVTVSEIMPFQGQDPRRASTCVSQCRILSKFPSKGGSLSRYILIDWEPSLDAGGKATKEVVPSAPVMRAYCLPEIVITLGEAFDTCGNNEVSDWLERTGVRCDGAPWGYVGRGTASKWVAVCKP